MATIQSEDDSNDALHFFGDMPIEVRTRYLIDLWLCELFTHSLDQPTT